MSEPRAYSLAHLSMLEVAPPDLVSVAADAGYEYVSVRVTASSRGIHHPMLGDSPMRRETIRRLGDTGVRVLDIEVIRLKPDTAVTEFAPLLEAAAELDARFAIVTIEDPVAARAAQTFGTLAALARSHGIRCALEFMVFSCAAGLPEAMAVLGASGASDAVVLVDPLHLARSGGAPADVAALPADRVAYVQMCDARSAAPAADPVAARVEAVNARLAPGAGVLPLRELIAATPASTILAPEVPTVGEVENPLAYARHLLASTRALLD